MLHRVQIHRLKKIALTFALASTAAPTLAATNEELDQRIRILERQLENQQEAADARNKDTPTVSASEKGFSIKKGDYELKIRALLQADARFFPDDTNGAAISNDTFLLRRLRPTFEGTLGKVVGFRLTPEFAPSNNNSDGGAVPSVVDAYIDLKFDPAATVRIGKQKGPVGLERLQSGGAISFIERGYVTELVPNRDIGAALLGEVLDGRLTYAIGLFNGTADGRDAVVASGDRRFETEGRVFAEPFRNDPGLWQGLGLGIAGSIGNKTNTGTANANDALPRYRSPGQNQIFSYAATVTPDGSHNRLVPQVTYYYNQFGLLAEYARNHQEVASGGVRRNFNNEAFEITTTYVLTGEDASIKGVVKPEQPFTLGGEGWGALELAARYGQLNVDDNTFSSGFASITSSINHAASFGVGLNWYLNSNLKLMLDYDQSQFSGGATAANGNDREIEKALFARVQITY